MNKGKRMAYIPHHKASRKRVASTSSLSPEEEEIWDPQGKMNTQSGIQIMRKILQESMSHPKHKVSWQEFEDMVQQKTN